MMIVWISVLIGRLKIPWQKEEESIQAKKLENAMAKAQRPPTRNCLSEIL